ncbi:DNA-directed RNA polymerase subunit beta [Vermiculatibacterium agrestimuris]|uniref:DNA-directed RNA polymerase subunit beta n=1 Tax=Vermiculatibacterium agrestimuris TaxID=2941519 RepID=UPI00203A4CED|nr:DNA-directed RNA polymerase subunit beta [Vermiculatibacterium agrestimuris]
MVKDVYYGKTLRKSFARHQEPLEMPNLLEIQKNSYRWFLEKGLREVFRDVAAITDYAGNLELSFIDYTMDEAPKYDVDECKARDATYAAPIKVRVRLRNKETEEIKEQEIFMGDFPLMTKAGTFVINGAERVIVSQIVRSPGIYYAKNADKAENLTYATTVIPYRGAWLEYETDLSDVFWVRIDKNRKIPITCLIRAVGPRTDGEILEMFGEDPRIVATMEKDTCKTYEEAMLEIYRKLRPGEPPTVDSAESLINALFFDARRYDLSAVGRYKFNKKLALAPRIVGQTLAQPVPDPATGEILAEAGETLTHDRAWELQSKGVNEVVLDVEGASVKVFSNHMVDMASLVSFDPEECGVIESVRESVLMDLIKQAGGDQEALKELVADHMDDLVPKHIIVDDIMASINYLNCLAFGVGSPDDIDHLGNRRLRCVGELLQNQFRIGFSRMERVIRERMTIQDLDIVTPQSLINIRPVTAAIKEFFGSSPLSQFMDQTNPLAELTHKRRVSALGPGGLSRDRASFDVRDIHYSHYGRLCPIETPEGPNIGLISYLASYAKVNRYGFIETPYRKIDKATGKVTEEVVYMTADVEDPYNVAQATEPVDENGCLVNERITCRHRNEIISVDRSQVDYIDVSPKMMVSIATAMIPFLENDDANRALMGANMQRQAVPLLTTEAPIVATGQEYKNCIDSEVVILAEDDGEVTRVSADYITIRYDDGRVVDHKLTKFMRSNHTTCINQRPIVNVGQRVVKGEVIVDGPSTSNGEIALGKNILMGFMTWEGYNYEDAILLNERMVKDDVFTSIHIEEYETEARDTKLGPEEITRDIPNVGEDALKDLDERGIIRVGAEVHPGDILVGKVTPKGETDLTAEERLLRAIFGEKAREVRDTSLKVPHGESGIIVNVDVFTRENGDELNPGVNQVVRIYIAQKRKISVGDKMAGRHGNKGVVSRILPQEDMPFLPDGTPLDIVLNPLGVPSRMNIGQVLEVHLGYAAKTLGWKVATPIFNGANESDIQALLKQAGLAEDGKSDMYDGRTGEKFDNRVTTGYVYFLKLHHLVDDKIHARSTGPYSLVTQQPLGGKAQFGGQRFGEMEMWALEAYGAAYTLREMLTVKSDDVTGRVKTYEAIVKGHNVPSPGVPEAFKVLVKELQALCLDVQVLDRAGEVIELKEDDEDTYPPDRVREDDDFYQYRDENEFAAAGYTLKENSDEDDLVIADEADDEDEDLADSMDGEFEDEE